MSSSASLVDVGIAHPAPKFALGSDLRALQERGHVRVAVQTDSPGFALKDPVTGKRTGLDIYLSKLIAQSIFGGSVDDAAARIEFVDVAVRDRITVCTSGEIDMVIAMFAVTEERRRQIDFTQAYFGSHLGVVVRSGEEEIDLGCSRLVVVESTTGADFVRKSGLGSKVVTVENNTDLLPLIESGEADAGINSIALLDGELSHNQHALTRPRVSFPFDTWAVGVNKDRSELRAFIDCRLAEIVDAGTVLNVPRTCV